MTKNIAESVCGIAAVAMVISERKTVKIACESGEVVSFAVMACRVMSFKE